jgi:tmRNA-binding protein
VFASIWIQICKGKKVYDKNEEKKEVEFDQHIKGTEVKV